MQLSLCGTSRRNLVRLAAAAVACLVLLAGCYVMRPSSGSGQTNFGGSRPLDPASVVVPEGYRVELVARGLTFPVGAAFDDEGRLYVVESGYSYGELFTEPRLLRVEANGSTTPVTSGAKGGPWTGVAFHGGRFYVADGNVSGEAGRVLRIGTDGRIETLVDGLPSVGDHHANGPLISNDGWLYFSVGTATNSGVVGEDNFKFGWLKRKPRFHDIPGQDITLTGENFESDDVFNPGRKASTGAFLPFGTPSRAGQVIKGAVKSSGSILRVRLDGGEPELIAWGFRNPFGLAFGPDGALYATDNGYDDRGSRKVWGAPDVLWRVEPRRWYGWPDYVGGLPITDHQFHGPGNKPLRFVIANHPNPVPQPVARFGVHSSADGLEFSRSQRFGYNGEAFVAIFGDQTPDTGKVLSPVGSKVVRVDPRTGVIHDFAVNRADRDGPASKVGGAGFERPVSVRFDRAGETLYVVDFGVLLVDKTGSKPKPNTGAVWRIRRGP